MSIDHRFAENHQPRLRLEAYSADWPSQFEAEVRRLQPAIGPTLVAIEHVGSTAVPGLAAKPIIDILAGVDGWQGFEEMIDRLGAIDYTYTPHSEKDDPARRVFRKGPENLRRLRSHNLHVTEFGSCYWQRLIAFRDHLRANPEDAAAYVRLKQELVRRFADQTRAYTTGKASFVREIEAKSGITRP